MNEEEIQKKALEVYPEIKLYEPYYDENVERREGYIKALTELEFIPKIKGWIVRDYIGDYLCFFNNKPIKRNKGRWEDENANTGSIITYGEDLYPELTWESEPLEIELILRKL